MTDRLWQQQWWQLSRQNK